MKSASARQLSRILPRSPDTLRVLSVTLTMAPDFMKSWEVCWAWVGLAMAKVSSTAFPLNALASSLSFGM